MTELMTLTDEKGPYVINVVRWAEDVDLPEPYKSRLLHWMQCYYLDSKNSCIGFLYHMMYGEELYHAHGVNMTPSLKPTDYVYLSKRHCDNSYFHYAMYVPTLQLYISQFGNGGAVVICDLEAMHRFCNTDTLAYVDTLELTY